MKYYTLIFVLSVFQPSLFAQTSSHVSGIVKTSDNEALSYANIKLTDKADKSKVYGVATDETGKFFLPVPPGLYLLEISFVGYTKYISSIQVSKDVKIPEIILNVQSNQIDEVVVTARTVTYKANGYTVGISNNPFYKEHELDNILKLTPGTNTDPMNGITVYGKAVSKIYINNREIHLKKEDLLQHLKNFNGQNVKEIEVTTSSGVEDDASSAGSSVIRITTKENENGGRLTTSAGYTFKSNGYYLTPNVNFQSRTGKWSTYLMTGLTSGESSTTNKTAAEFYNLTARISTENQYYNSVKHNYRSTLGLGYDINKHNLISAEIFLRSALFAKDNNLVTSQWDQNFNDFVQTATGFSENERTAENFNASLNYTHLFGKTGRLEFKFDRLHTDEENIQKDQYIFSSDSSNRYNNHNNGKNVIYTAVVNYMESFDKLEGKLSTGLKYSNISNENFTDYKKYINEILDNLTSYTDLYNYSEQVYAAFAKYSFMHKSVSATLGLRLEHSVIFPRSADNAHQNLKSDYTDLFPEFSINWDLNKDRGHNMSMNYKRSIRRPSMRSLNPLIIWKNNYSYSMGNPFLKPYYGNSFSLRSVFSDKYLVNVTYLVSKDKTFYITGIDPSTNILYTQLRNGMKFNELSVYAECPITVGSWGNLKLNGDFGFVENEYKTDKVSTTNWNVGMSGMFQLPYGINVMLNISYYPGRKFLYSKSYAQVYSTLYISKSFLKKQLVTTILFNDIFNRFGSERNDNFSDVYYQSSMNTFKNFSVVLRASYTLKWGNKSAKINRTKSGNTNEQSRVKTD